MNDILNILSILEGCCMFLTFGQLAGLIAALAFLVLVIYLCRVLARLTSTVSELTKSIKRNCYNSRSLEVYAFLSWMRKLCCMSSFNRMQINVL